MEATCGCGLRAPSLLDGMVLGFIPWRKIVDILSSGSQYNWGIQKINYIWGGCEINQLTVTCNEKWGSDKVTVKLHPERAPQKSAANRRRFIRTSHWWQVLKSARYQTQKCLWVKTLVPLVPKSAENSFGLGLFSTHCPNFISIPEWVWRMPSLTQQSMPQGLAFAYTLQVSHLPTETIGVGGQGLSTSVDLSWIHVRKHQANSHMATQHGPFIKSMDDLPC